MKSNHEYSYSEWVKLNFSGYEALSDFLNAKADQGETLTSEAQKLAEQIANMHDKKISVREALKQLKYYEESLGQKMENHRGHISHSLDVYLLGMILVNKNLVNGFDKPANFEFAWLFACLFHDVGYIFELQAKSEETSQGNTGFLGQLQKKELMDTRWSLARDFHELRNLPLLEKIDGDDQPGTGGDWKKFAENNEDRIVKESTDILDLMAYRISKSVSKNEGFRSVRNSDIFRNECEFESYVLTQLEKTFAASFRVFDDKSFDHGKIGAFVFLHEMHALYAEKRKNYGVIQGSISWHRANLYVDLMDAAVAIYMHNTLRFQRHLLGVSKETTYTPQNLPPLTYLLMLCDLLVEWDKPQLGSEKSEKGELKSSEVKIDVDDDKKVTFWFPDEKSAPDTLNKELEELFGGTRPAFVRGL